MAEAGSDATSSKTQGPSTASDPASSDATAAASSHVLHLPPRGPLELLPQRSNDSNASNTGQLEAPFAWVCPTTATSRSIGLESIAEGDSLLAEKAFAGPRLHGTSSNVLEHEVSGRVQNLRKLARSESSNDRTAPDICLPSVTLTRPTAEVVAAQNPLEASVPSAEASPAMHALPAFGSLPNESTLNGTEAPARSASLPEGEKEQEALRASMNGSSTIEAQVPAALVKAAASKKTVDALQALSRSSKAPAQRSQPKETAQKLRSSAGKARTALNTFLSGSSSSKKPTKKLFSSSKPSKKLPEASKPECLVPEASEEPVNAQYNAFAEEPAKDEGFAAVPLPESPESAEKETATGQTCDAPRSALMATDDAEMLSAVSTEELADVLSPSAAQTFMSDDTSAHGGTTTSQRTLVNLNLTNEQSFGASSSASASTSRRGFLENSNLNPPPAGAGTSPLAQKPQVIAPSLEKKSALSASTTTNTNSVSNTCVEPPVATVEDSATEASQKKVLQLEFQSQQSGVSIVESVEMDTEPELGTLWHKLQTNSQQSPVVAAPKASAFEKTASVDMMPPLRPLDQQDIQVRFLCPISSLLRVC